MSIKIGALSIHRKEQWDLDCWPLICAHWNTPNRSRRVFCLWRWGIQVGRGRVTQRSLSRFLFRLLPYAGPLAPWVLGLAIGRRPRRVR
jgi:hypothetical protein